MYHITLIGASGYTGAEFCRLIAGHPNFTLQHLVSSSSTERYDRVYPNFTGSLSLSLEPLDIEKLDQDTDVYVTALPHGTSMTVVSDLYHKTTKPIVDLGADFRYQNHNTYEAWYHLPHTAKDIPSVYGLCELNRESIQNTRVVGNPGCYTTCSILSLAPLIKNHLVKPDSIVIDAKSGVTGAGKKCTQGNHFCETNENAKAYSVATHRHTSEIEEQLSLLYGKPLMLNFTPHLIPVNRGILATCYATLESAITQDELHQLYEHFYQASPFVKILKDRQPELKFVVGSNRAHLHVEVDERTGRVIVTGVLDNLIKGASGQAIQNLNLLFHLAEDTGLNMPAWYL